MDKTAKKTNLRATIRNMQVGAMRKIPRVTTSPHTVRSTIFLIKEAYPEYDYSTRTTPGYTIVTRLENKSNNQ